MFTVKLAGPRAEFRPIAVPAAGSRLKHPYPASYFRLEPTQEAAPNEVFSEGRSLVVPSPFVSCPVVMV
jgi:hypothetical protein